MNVTVMRPKPFIRIGRSGDYTLTEARVLRDDLAAAIEEVEGGVSKPAPTPTIQVGTRVRRTAVNTHSDRAHRKGTEGVVTSVGVLQVRVRTPYGDANWYNIDYEIVAPALRVGARVRRTRGTGTGRYAQGVQGEVTKVENGGRSVIVQTPRGGASWDVQNFEVIG